MIAACIFPFFLKIIEITFHVFCRLPDSPKEPDPENQEHVEPKIIPIEDVSIAFRGFQLSGEVL